MDTNIYENKIAFILEFGGLRFLWSGRIVANVRELIAPLYHRALQPTHTHAQFYCVHVTGGHRHRRWSPPLLLHFWLAFFLCRPLRTLQWHTK